MLDLLHLIVLQVVFESFPISSSGHLLLALCICAYYNVQNYILLHVIQSEIVTFLMHVPTVFVVAVFFFKTWIKLLINLRTQWRIVAKLIMYTACADGVTSILFLFIKYFELSIPLWLGFSGTALMLYSLTWCSNQRRTVLAPRHMLLLGFMQGVAVFPGISRFAAVFVTSRWLGVGNKKAFNVSWMLQWPLIVGASLLGIVGLMGGADGISFGLSEWILLVLAVCIALWGMYVAYLLALYNKLWLVSIYMIVPLVLSLVFCM